MSISLFADSYTRKSADQLLDIRFVGAIEGRYSLASRRDARSGEVRVFPCQLISISTTAATLRAAEIGKVGESVSFKLQDFNIVTGRISRIFENGFAVDFDIPESEQEEIAVKIDWIKKRRFRALRDKRQDKRIVPANGRSAVTLSDGSVCKCTVIDISRTGAAVSANVRPKVGASAALGLARGKVVRHLPDGIGFAIRFDEKLDLAQMDDVFGWSVSFVDNLIDAALT